MLITGTMTITTAAAGGAVGAPAQPAGPSGQPASYGQPAPSDQGRVVPKVSCDPTGQSGGNVAQSTVLARAAAWVAANVPYNTNGCARRAEGSYREDCSGFVSMAWALATSLNTWAFNPATNGGDSRFVPIAQTSLVPGDALVADNSSTNHIALFTGWGTTDAGRHRYANLSEESQPGVGTIAITNQDLAGYWSMYTPIHYTRMTTSNPVSQLGATVVSPTTSRVNFFVRGSNGVLQMPSYVTGSGWAPTQRLGAPSGGLSWDADAGTWGAGRLDVATRTGQGHLATRDYSPQAGWSDWYVHSDTTLAPSPTVVDDAVGNVDVFYLGANHGLVNVHWSSATGWTGQRTVPGVTNAASGPDATAWHVGTAHIDVAYRSTANTPWLVSYTSGWTAARQVAPASPLPASPAALDPGTGSTTSGNLSVYYTATTGVIYRSSWDQTSQAWTAWLAVPGNAAATAAPDAASESMTHVDVVTANAGHATTASWNGTAWSAWQSLP
ncbi:MAG: hypothetical protein QOD45_1488 [Pseudonocardiales bacterium]|jgi:hypothetical protein|nr:hypothetical protein [Pseudonocardiales bacterium]